MGTLQQGNRSIITAVLVTNFNFYTMTRNKILTEILNLQFEFYRDIIAGKRFDDIIW